MIITLAGHVDHGKTSLVKALSGVDTDRLAEEKQRGLTIDLGFAYIDQGRIGFVDVPGHHRFIHNMVAGVASNQTALLVIAADDGPMPQSQEHLDILQLLGIEQGIIALTKCDRASAERIAQCQQEIANLVNGTFLSNAPIFQTSIEDPDSIIALLEHLRSLQARDSEDLNKPFRLAVDRAFSIKGSGLVVTGTAHQGVLHTEDTLYHFPSGSQVRVRGLRAQDQEVQQVQQGERCAVNLSGLDTDATKRGDWLSATPPAACMELTVNLSTLSRFPRPVKHWTPVHIYHATSHSTGHIALHASGALQPGETALCDLVLDEPLWALHGDQVIVRDHGLDTTLGGGNVVYTSDQQSNRRRNQQRIDQLNAHSQQDIDATIAELLDGGDFRLDDLQRVRQVDADALKTLLGKHDALQVNGQAIRKTQLSELAKQALIKLQTHAKDHPDSPGLKSNEFSLPEAFAPQILAALVQAKAVTLKNGVYDLASRKVELPPELEARYEKLRKELDSLQPPSSGDLAKSWRVDQKGLEQDLRELGRRGLVTFVANHRYYLPEKLQEIATIVKNMAANAPFTVREFRDHTGIGRNVAIDVLEYFDSRGFTRRQDNHRQVLRDEL